MVLRPASDVSRRINAERLLLIAWLRAILLQFAHPLIAAAVAEHSSFRGSTTAAAARLRHTVHAMLALTFGSDAERDAAGGNVVGRARVVTSRVACWDRPALRATEHVGRRVDVVERDIAREHGLLNAWCSPSRRRTRA